MNIPFLFGPGKVRPGRIWANFDEFVFFASGNITLGDMAASLTQPLVWTLSNGAQAAEVDAKSAPFFTTAGTGQAIHISQTGGGSAPLINIQGNVASTATMQANVTTLSLTKTAPTASSTPFVDLSQPLRLPTSTPSSYVAGSAWYTGGELRIASSASDPLPLGNMDGATLSKGSGKIALNISALYPPLAGVIEQPDSFTGPSVTITGNYSGRLAMITAYRTPGGVVNNDTLVITGPSSQTATVNMGSQDVDKASFRGPRHFCVMNMVDGANTFSTTPANTTRLTVQVLGQGVAF